MQSQSEISHVLCYCSCRLMRCRFVIKSDSIIRFIIKLTTWKENAFLQRNIKYALCMTC